MWYNTLINLGFFEISLGNILVIILSSLLFSKSYAILRKIGEE